MAKFFESHTNKFPKLSATIPVGLLNLASVPELVSIVFVKGYGIVFPATPVVLPAIVVTNLVLITILRIELFP